VNQRLRQPNTLKHPLGETLETPVMVRRQSDQVDQFWNPLPQILWTDAAEPSVQA
jgi:hypothetical protein